MVVGNSDGPSDEATLQDRVNWWANLLFFTGLLVYFIYYVSKKDQTVCSYIEDGNVASR